MGRKEGGSGMVILPSESGLLSSMYFCHLYGTIMAKQTLRSKTNANLFAAEYILVRLCWPSVFQNRKQAIWLCHSTIIV